MPIKSTRYVNITSGVVGASSVAIQALTGRRFTDNPLVPVDRIVTVLNNGAGDYFGPDAPETAFASQYFSYISPAPASQASDLQFAAYAPSGRAPTLFGARNTTPLATLQAVTDGSLSVTLGNTVGSITGLSLAAATSYADVASAIQSALRAAYTGDPQFGSVLVSYDAVSGEFRITGAATSAAAASVNASGAGTDLGTLLNLNGAGSVASPGVSAQTPLAAFLAAEQISDSFGSATFSDESVTLEQIVDLAAYVAAQNVKYQLYVSVSRASYESWAAALLSTPSVGLILNATAGEYKEALPMAIMAATDYSRRNATVNFMFRQGALTGDVVNDAESRVLDAARVNYYGVTASAGQRISFFQRGYLMGGATAPLDMNVHANEQWFKAFLSSALLSLEISSGSIPANNDGRGLILAQLSEGITRAKFNGTIRAGKTLTAAQKIAVTQLTGDELAWQDVQTNGYWADVAIVEEVGPSGIAEYVAKYTIAYGKNDVVRKIDGSHNLV